LGNSRRDSAEVVSFAQLSIGRQEETHFEAVRSSEGSRASFLCAETHRQRIPQTILQMSRTGASLCSPLRVKEEES
jgi:hypothetical protein